MQFRRNPGSSTWMRCTSREVLDADLDDVVYGERIEDVQAEILRRCPDAVIIRPGGRPGVQLTPESIERYRKLLCADQPAQEKVIGVYEGENIEQSIRRGHTSILGALEGYPLTDPRSWAPVEFTFTRSWLKSPPFVFGHMHYRQHQSGGAVKVNQAVTIPFVTPFQFAGELQAHLPEGFVVCPLIGGPLQHSRVQQRLMKLRRPVCAWRVVIIPPADKLERAFSKLVGTFPEKAHACYRVGGEGGPALERCAQFVGDLFRGQLQVSEDRWADNTGLHVGTLRALLTALFEQLRGCAYAGYTLRIEQSLSAEDDTGESYAFCRRWPLQAPQLVSELLKSTTPVENLPEFVKFKPHHRHCLWGFYTNLVAVKGYGDAFEDWQKQADECLEQWLGRAIRKTLEKDLEHWEIDQQFSDNYRLRASIEPDVGMSRQATQVSALLTEVSKLQLLKKLRGRGWAAQLAQIPFKVSPSILEPLLSSDVPWAPLKAHLQDRLRTQMDVLQKIGPQGYPYAAYQKLHARMLKALYAEVRTRRQQFSKRLGS